MSTNSQSLITVTAKLSGAIASCRFVTFAGLQAGAGEKCLGVTIQGGAIGDAVSVAIHGTGSIQSGGVFAKGDPLVSDALGQAVKAVSGGINAGTALEASTAAGQTIEILINSGSTKNDVSATIDAVTGEIRFSSGMPDRATPFSRVRVATLGDSTANWGQFRSTAEADQSTMNSAIPASSVLAPAINQDKVALLRYYPNAHLIGNCGISGETTTQILARDSLAASATRRSLFDVISLRPDVVLLRAGSINDLTGFTPATPQASIDAVFERHMRIVDTLVGQGARVIDAGIYGFDATLGTPPPAENLAFIRAALVSLNARYKEAMLGRRNCRFIDTAGVTHDGSGRFLPGATLSTDGTHITFAAQDRMAELEAGAMSDWFGRPSLYAYPGLNLLGSDSLFHTPTPFGGWGNVQSGYAWAPSNCVRSNADLVTRDNNRWMMCESATPGTAPKLAFYPPLTVAGGSPSVVLVQGRVYGIEADAFIETLDGATLGDGVCLTAMLNLYNVTNAGRIALGVSTSPVGYGVKNKLHGKLVFPPFVAPESSANIGATSNGQLYFTASGATGQNFRAGFAAPRIVDITDTI